MIKFIDGSSFDRVINPYYHREGTFSLLDPSNILSNFKNIPKTFEISTNNGSCHFNISVLEDMSITISNYMKNNPSSKKYHLSLNNNMVLKKIEELCQGNLIKINEDEFPEYQNIIKMLQIQQLEKYNIKGLLNKNGIIIAPYCSRFFYSIRSIGFKIKTNSKAYSCNLFGACSSSVIRDYIIKHPDSDCYTYKNDDEFQSFITIRDLFNYNSIKIPSEIKYIKKIAEDLKIDIILDKIDQFCQEQNRIAEIIDGQQELIDTINMPFEWLYQINELSVQNVKELIIESKWSKSEESIKELAAFIIQVIKAKEQLHLNLIELLIQLNSENSKELKILLPFVKEKIMISFSFDDSMSKYDCSFDDSMYKNVCSFIYKLFRKEIISKEELFNELIKIQRGYSFNLRENTEICFLPELIEIYGLDICEKFFKNKTIQYFLPDKIDLYNKMRDSGEPNDKIATALKNDDVDTLQKHMIQSMSSIKDFSKFVIHPTIFESINEQNVSYINYSAAYGSLKCFKYLLLNQSKINKLTFYYSIYGDNIEIIKIVDNYLKENNIDCYGNDDFQNKTDEKDIINVLFYLIANHKNNLFDWFFEQMKNYKLIDNYLYKIINCAVSNGNVHALISFIDRKFNILGNKEDFLSTAAFNGFYHFLKFLYNIINQQNENKYWDHYNYDCVSFGSLPIFKFFMTTKTKPSRIDSAIQKAIVNNQTKMINYFLDEQSNKITHKTISAIFVKSLQISDELFYSFFDKFKKSVPLVFQTYIWSMSLLELACKHNRIESFKTIINLINIDEQTNFTDCLYRAVSSGSIEICSYIVNHKFYISYKTLFQKISYLNETSREIILLLFNNSGLKCEASIFTPLLFNAIKHRNRNFVEFLIENNIFYDDCLRDSVFYYEYSNNDIINIILKHNSNPSFINKVFPQGTVLHIAVENERLNDVKLLLSIPSINPFVLNKENQTPIMVASKRLGKYNETIYDILYELLLFCGNNIILYNNTINFLICSLFEKNYYIDKRIIILEKLLNIENIEFYFVGDNFKYLINLITMKNTQLIKMFLKFNSININSILPNGDTPLITALKTEDQDIINLFINDPRIDFTKLNKKGENLFKFIPQGKISETVEQILSIPSINPINIDFIFNYFIDSMRTSNNTNETNYNIIEKILCCPNIVTKILYRIKNYYFPIICTIPNVDINLVQLLLKNENIDVNIGFPTNGDSFLIFALKSNRIDIAQLLINDPRTDINITNSEHESALIIAVKNQLTSIVKLLINHEKFDPDLSYASYAYMISNDEISDILSSLNSVDINILPIYFQKDETPLIQEASKKNLKKIEQIIKHPKFDENQSKLFKTIEIIIESKEQDIINEFFKILINNKLINYCMNSNDNHLFCNILSTINTEILDEFLDDKNISSLNILSLFNCSLNSGAYSIKIMTTLLNYDKKHQNLIDLKKNSYLTKIRNSSKDHEKYVENIVNFIIENGGDVNAADENGVFPFEYAIMTNFVELVMALIKTNKVDYHQAIHQKINNNKKDKIISESYLHLAAKQNEDIFKLILETKFFNINARNSINETPLMIACKYLNTSNIMILFQHDDIDFHCKNDMNEDALKIISKTEYLNANKFGDDDDHVDQNESYDTLSKEQYLKLLLNVIDDKNIKEKISENLRNDSYSLNSDNDINDPTPYDGWEINPRGGWGCNC